MSSHAAARTIAWSVGTAAEAIDRRSTRLGGPSNETWSGRAHDAAVDQRSSLRSSLDISAQTLVGVRNALLAFAEQAESADRLRSRGAALDTEAARLSRRWRESEAPEPIDPGWAIHRQATRLRADADAVENAAAAIAASVIDAAADTIQAQHRNLTHLAPTGFGIFDDIGDLLDDVVTVVGRGVGWGWDRTTDLADWAARQADNIVDGVVWVGDRVIDVGQSVTRRLIDEAHVNYARLRFPADFALFHATGNTPDGLPPISEEYRRTQNVWSYSLIPAIEESGGECTQLDNGIFACLSDGIELPGNLGTVPLKGRGGTTYGEVFIVDDPARYERVQEPGSPLADHEKNHSIQWAVHGPAAFTLLYLQDAALSGNDGARQYFEQQADAEAGGYDTE